MKKVFLIFFCILQSLNLFSQATGDYRSTADVEWNAVTTWQRFDGTNWVSVLAPPSSADGVITIRNPHSVTASTAVTADQLIVAGGATLTITGDDLFTVADGTGADLLVTGTLHLGGATLTGTGSVSVNGTMLWSSGTMDVPLTVASGATLDINVGSSKTLTNVLTIASGGTANWNGGTINFNNGTLTIKGTFNNNFDGNLSAGGGTNQITNNGVFQKSGGSGATYVQVPFTNNNVIKGIQEIVFDAAFNNMGSVNPGLSLGILTANTTVSPLFTSSSNLNIEMLSGDGPGTGHDQLQHSGNLVLDGTLNVTEIGNVPGGTYTIVSLTSGTSG